MNFRIIDGELADIKEFPFQVSIIYKNLHHCGGSIISKWHILTAAHCAVRYVEPSSNLFQSNS